PAAGVFALLQNGHGCRHLLKLWTELNTIMDRMGYWPEAAWTRAVRALSADPACPGAGGQTPYLCALYSLAAQPIPDHERIARLAAPECRPPALAHADLPAAIPGPEACKQWIKSLIASKIEGLALLEAALREGKDASELAHVIARAQLPGNSTASLAFR